MEHRFHSTLRKYELKKLKNMQLLDITTLLAQTTEVQLNAALSSSRDFRLPLGGPLAFRGSPALDLRVDAGAATILHHEME